MISSRFREPIIAAFFTCAVVVAGATAVRFGSWQAATNELPPSVVAAPAISTPAKVVSKMTNFAPNYAADLLNLRRWQKSILTVFVEQPTAAQNPTRRDYAVSVREGATLWTPYLGDMVAMRFTNNATEADVRVSFTEKGALPDGAIGRTEVTYRNRDNIIVAATVRLDRTLKSDLLAQVAAHELGHALGMEGHSVDRTDLMYSRAHLPGVITMRDSNTLHLNYSLAATRVNARPAAQVTGGSVAVRGGAATTSAACSLPEEAH